MSDEQHRTLTDKETEAIQHALAMVVASTAKIANTVDKFESSPLVIDLLHVTNYEKRIMAESLIDLFEQATRVEIVYHDGSS